ncbi:MAG: TlpA family protein disulfide reductase, partial [Spirochaeta sp.]
LAGWKLSPLLFSFQTILESPIALLYLPGGAAGTALGITGAAGYIIFRHRHILSGQTAYARHLMRGLGIMLAVVLIIWIPGSRIAAILQQPQGTGGTTAAAVHTAAPDFTLNSLAGEEVSLSDLQGTPTVLNFWATWCPPCRAEFPELVALQQEFGESLQVVGINLTHSERSRQDVADFIARYEPGFLHLLDQDGAVQARYNVRVVPTTLILDSRGIIVHRRVGAVSAAVLRNHIP